MVNVECILCILTLKTQINSQTQITELVYKGKISVVARFTGIFQLPSGGVYRRRCQCCARRLPNCNENDPKVQKTWRHLQGEPGSAEYPSEYIILSLALFSTQMIFRTVLSV